MPANKNQHFVPRVHLNPFTLHGAGLAIKVFLIGSNRFVPNAPAKHQCSEDYFYGKDQDFEKAIQATESEYGLVLKKIFEATELIEVDRSTLKAFWLWQNFRTQATASEISGFHGILDANSQLPPMSQKEGMLRSVEQMGRQFYEAMHELARFECRIVVNGSDVDFCTSDHPAILTNRLFFQTPQEPHAYFGLLTPGLVGFLPLTPRRCLIVFDPSSYDVEQGDDQGFLSIDDAADIHAINVHQFVNCVSNIYVGDGFSEQIVRDEFKRVQHRRTTREVLIQPVLADPESTLPDFLHPTDRMRDPGEWPSQIVVR